MYSRGKQNRLLFIDAMRSLGIFLVVAVHVETFIYTDYVSLLGKIITSFFMQLFFFISGFCAYKKEYNWSMNSCFRQIINKFTSLVLPTIIWGLIYNYIVLNEDLNYFLRGPYKAGYWFTLCLFEIFVIYYIVNGISYKIWKRGEKVESISLLFTIMLAIIFLSLKIPFNHYPLLDTIGCYSSLHFTFTYYIYFVLGLICSKYRSRLTTKISNPLCIVVFFLSSFLINYYIPEIEGLWGMIIKEISEIIVGVSGVLMIFFIFSKYSDCFHRNKYLNSTIQFLGRRTLDIYFIHYFFLVPLPKLSSFLLTSSCGLLDFIVDVILSIIIIILCLLISRLLRGSRVLEKIFFGFSMRINN